MRVCARAHVHIYTNIYMSHMNVHSSVNNRHPVFSVNHSIMIAHSFISFLIFNYLNTHSGHLLSFGLRNTHPAFFKF